MQVIDKNISELVEYENNPRNNDDAVEPVAKSIREFGWKQPIVIDKHNVIIAGHTRFRAAKQLSLETVPCVVADDLSEDEVRAYRIVDNKAGEYATWNIDLLKSELANIEFDLSSYEFPDFADMPDISDDIKELQYREKFGVVADCKDEAEQRAAFELLDGAGYSARIVSI